MDPISRHPVFLFLVCLPGLTLAAHVEPPTNVTLHCHNLHNVLKWSYDRPFPGLKFKVDFGSIEVPPQVIWVDPPTLQVDVPIRSNPSYDYYLSVTAVDGESKSDAAPPDGITFSYFRDSQEMQKCHVDFPFVNVTAQPDDFILFRFTHPWLLYHHKLPDSLNPKYRKKRNYDEQIIDELPMFNYKVVILHQEEKHHDFSCVDSVCEEKLPVDAAQKKHCLRMEGELEKIFVHSTQKYCALPFDATPHWQKNNTYIYVGVSIGVLALIAVAFVFIMVYKKHTKTPSSLPSSMNFKDRLRQWTFQAVPDLVDVPDVEPTSPTPLLPPQETELTPAVIPSTQTDLRLPIGVTAEDEGVCVEEVRIDEGPGYSRGMDFDADESSYDSSKYCGYERREKVFVALGTDEQAEGYRGTEH